MVLTVTLSKPIPVPALAAAARTMAYAYEFPDGSWTVRLRSVLREGERVRLLYPPVPEALALQMFPAYQALEKPYRESFPPKESQNEP